jgi:hypothetical protein
MEALEIIRRMSPYPNSSWASRRGPVSLLVAGRRRARRPEWTAAPLIEWYEKNKDRLDYDGVSSLLKAFRETSDGYLRLGLFT